MGAKISIIQGVVPCWVKHKSLYVRDLLGKVHKGTIDVDINFDKDSRAYRNPVFVNLVKGDMQLVCRHDSTYSVYKVTSRELLDIGAFQLDDPSILETEYTEIGYLRYGPRIYTLVLDLHNRMLVHAIKSTVSPAEYSFRFREPFNMDIDLQRSMVEAHRDPNLSRFELFIYTKSGHIDWREMLVEIPRNV